MNAYFTPRAWLLAALLAFPVMASNAAEVDDEPAADNAEVPTDELPADAGGTPGKPEAPPGGEAKPKPGDDPSVFVPTEEISEDFAVSFPVDI